MLTPRVVLLLSLGAAVAQDAPAAPPSPPNSCPCAASNGKSSDFTVTLAGETLTYPAAYGEAVCAAHDANLEPYCVTDAPSWCADSWCYVDENDCDQPMSESVRSCDCL